MDLSSQSFIDNRTQQRKITQKRIKYHHIRTFSDHLYMMKENSSYYYMVSGHLVDRIRSKKQYPRKNNVRLQLPPNVIFLVCCVDE
jgi:hypothetical protein